MAQADAHPASPHRVFLLSPAHSGGKRAGYLLRDGADFDLAQRVRAPGGAPLGDVFTFLSGLYFRGKLAYARSFGNSPPGVAGVHVIVPGRGLASPDVLVTLSDLREIAGVPVDLNDPRYSQPLLRDARALAAALGQADEAVLLGSIATAKYIDLLSEALGARLRFPADFVGRGDMSRGALMLRCVREHCELRYVALDGTSRHGARPAKSEPPRAM